MATQPTAATIAEVKHHTAEVNGTTLHYNLPASAGLRSCSCTGSRSRGGPSTSSSRCWPSTTGSTPWTYAGSVTPATPRATTAPPPRPRTCISSSGTSLPGRCTFSARTSAGASSTASPTTRPRGRAQPHRGRDESGGKVRRRNAGRRHQGRRAWYIGALVTPGIARLLSPGPGARVHRRSPLPVLRCGGPGCHRSRHHRIRPHLRAARGPAQRRRALPLDAE